MDLARLKRWIAHRLGLREERKQVKMAFRCWPECTNITDALWIMRALFEQQRNSALLAAWMQKERPAFGFEHWVPPVPRIEYTFGRDLKIRTDGRSIYVNGRADGFGVQRLTEWQNRTGIIAGRAYGLQREFRAPKAERRRPLPRMVVPQEEVEKNREIYKARFGHYPD